MSAEAILILLVVGLIAGWLASMVVRSGGLGVVGDIVVGIAGAFLGHFLFRALHIVMPVAGIAGSILVAFIGAVVLLLILRLVRRGMR